MRQKLNVYFLMVGFIALLGLHCKNTHHHSKTNTQNSIMGVPFTDVKMKDDFWKPRIDINREVTITTAFQKCEETGRIDNFALAGGLISGEHKGDFPFDDTDVYKVIEGASYVLAAEYDPALDAYLDSVIILIAAAQEEDGYLYTARTNRCERQHRWMGDERWEKLNSHELYNCGHLYEAAVAHHLATGKESLLDVAIKNADLVCEVFGPDDDQLQVPSGHPIIEMALVKLYMVTGDAKYLDQAKFFIDETGIGSDGHALSMYSQDHMPIREQAEAVGHAVRFAYLYSGVADVGGLKDDPELIGASKRVWENMAGKKLYITGGIGARAMGEGFGNNYELPNMTAYCETCASIANVYWNYRMFLLTGDARYYDVLERTLYNSFLSGISLSGDLFFYDNVLESDGTHEREPWFGCACCPGNVTRFMASVPGYFYATAPGALYINLFAQTEAKMMVNGTEVTMKQETAYPWKGKVKIFVQPKKNTTFDLHIRIPGWALNSPVPSDLYRFLDKNNIEIQVAVNGTKVPVNIDHGYANIHREWADGDFIEIEFPMPVRRITAIDSVVNNRGKVAVQRGPIVYCMEGKDQEGGHVFNLYLPDEEKIGATRLENDLGEYMQLHAQGYGVFRLGNSIRNRPSPLTFIPYYAWNNRGRDEMEVWIPRSVETAILTPNPSMASQGSPSASTGWVPGLNDQFEPTHSGDTDKAFFYWWLKKGSEEWVQYDFDKTESISSSEVYWLNYDHYDQDYRVPESWELLYKDGDQWKPVNNTDPYGVLLDQYNLVRFEPVSTTSIRLMAKLQGECSGGILEWKIE